MRLGQRTICYPQSFEQVDNVGRTIKGPMSGTIAWIHPTGRFAVVEFETAGGILRECFPVGELTGGRA